MMQIAPRPHIVSNILTVLVLSFCETGFQPNWLEGGELEGRCGKQFLKHDGAPSGCNPFKEANERGPCCLNLSWCGNTEGHCSCETCVDYRKTDPIPSIFVKFEGLGFPGNDLAEFPVDSYKTCLALCAPYEECAGRVAFVESLMMNHVSRGHLMM